MRKDRLLLTVLCMVMILLTACNQSKTAEQSDMSEVDYCGIVDKLPSYCFDSVEEVMEALTIWGRESYCKIREKSHYVELSGTYRQTILAFEDRSIKLAVPQLDGEDFPNMINEGHSDIVIHSSLLYELPWIQYKCFVDEILLTVRICYVSMLNDENIDNASSAMEIGKILDPDGKPGNYYRYEFIGEQEIQLSDRTVKAMISKTDTEQIAVMMLYDQLLIMLEIDDIKLFTADFLKKFGIRYVS